MDLRGIGRRRHGFAHAVLHLFTYHGRALPWRNISDPYRILVSEIMLQQTYMSRVLATYPGFLRRFPSIRKLAAARQKDVVIAWQGMGYNNRAVRLHRLAKTIIHEYGGRFPRTEAEMLALPGVGRYTANAMLSSVFKKDVPVVDVNIRRVFSRVFWPMKTTATLRPEKDIWHLAQKLVPAGNAYRWNQALMDLGATICTARSPACVRCPLARRCASTKVMKRAVSSGRPAATGKIVPNRIYRGRIIETLRHHDRRRNLRTDTLARAIHPRYGRNQKQWLESLLAGLEKDGLIKRSRKGRWNERRISLA